MGFKDVVKRNLVEYYAVLKRKLDGLTDEELRWQPDPESNHILWTVWHMSRVEDTWISTLQGLPGIWVSDEWHERLGMTLDRHGRGDSLDEVEASKAFNIAEAMEYYESGSTKKSDSLNGMAFQLRRFVKSHLIRLGFIPRYVDRLLMKSGEPGLPIS